VERLLFSDPVTFNKTFFHVWVTSGRYKALAARGFPSHKHDRDECLISDASEVQLGRGHGLSR
jgi:hypothetical protein